MTTTFAKVAFINKATGARLEGEHIADTGPTWLIKPDGRPALAILKAEWESVAPQSADTPFDFNKLFGGNA